MMIRTSVIIVVLLRLLPAVSLDICK